jgi:hypothetical protein
VTAKQATTPKSDKHLKFILRLLQRVQKVKNDICLRF